MLNFVDRALQSRYFFEFQEVQNFLLINSLHIYDEIICIRTELSYPQQLYLCILEAEFFALLIARLRVRGHGNELGDT